MIFNVTGKTNILIKLGMSESIEIAHVYLNTYSFTDFFYKH